MTSHQPSRSNLGPLDTPPPPPPSSKLPLSKFTHVVLEIVCMLTCQRSTQLPVFLVKVWHTYGDCLALSLTQKMEKDLQMCLGVLLVTSVRLLWNLKAAGLHDASKDKTSGEKRDFLMLKFTVSSMVWKKKKKTLTKNEYVTSVWTAIGRARKRLFVLSPSLLFPLYCFRTRLTRRPFDRLRWPCSCYSVSLMHRPTNNTALCLSSSAPGRPPLSPAPPPHILLTTREVKVFVLLPGRPVTKTDRIPSLWQPADTHLRGGWAVTISLPATENTTASECSRV